MKTELDAGRRVTLKPAAATDRGRADPLFQLYIAEMLHYTDREALPNLPLTDYLALLSLYWERDDHYPFLIFCDGELAGFSLVRRYPADRDVYDMGQFFVLDRFRRQGVGHQAARLTHTRLPGRWLTRVLPKNQRALSFWKNVIAAQTGGNYQLSRELDRDQEMNFIRYTVHAEPEQLSTGLQRQP